MTRLYAKYQKEIVPSLREKFGYPNILAVPKVSKVTVNVGVGKFVKEPGFLESVEKTLRQITGQAPVKTKAKQSISSFKIRQGMVVGFKVTLRRQRMYDFIDKLINVTLPRTRDLRGLSTDAANGHGNTSADSQIKKASQVHDQSSAALLALRPQTRFYARF